MVFVIQYSFNLLSGFPDNQLFSLSVPSFASPETPSVVAWATYYSWKSSILFIDLHEETLPS